MVVLRKLVPLVLIVVFTYKLVRALMARTKYRTQTLHRRANLHDNHNETVTVVLITIAVVFILCQAPMAVYPILRLAIKPPQDSVCNAYIQYATVADTLAVLNSAVNFLVYYPFIPVFRKTLADICKGRRHKKDIEQQEQHSPSEHTFLTKSPNKQQTAAHDVHEDMYQENTRQ